MKNWILKFLVSRAGGVLTPILATVVAMAVTRVADFDGKLAASIDQNAVVGFLLAAILAGVNAFTNAKQSDGVKKIQALVNTDVDGVPGPVTYTEVRRAIAVADK